MLFAQLYIPWPRKYLYVHKKKTLNEKKKKCKRIFNKKTTLYARLGSKQKAVSNCQATYQENFVCRLKIWQFLSQSERTDRLDPPPTVRFSSLFQAPPPARQTYFLNNPISVKVFTIIASFALTQKSFFIIIDF